MAFKASPSSQHRYCTDEAQKAETVLSVVVVVVVVVVVYVCVILLFAFSFSWSTTISPVEANQLSAILLFLF